jgi:hypothetical protein
VLDFLLDDDFEDNAESEITAFMRERVDPDTDSLAWWKDNSDKYSRRLCHVTFMIVIRSLWYRVFVKENNLVDARR